MPSSRTPAFPDRERLLVDLFERAPARMAILDGAGRVIEVNLAWRETVADGGCPIVSADVGVDYPAALRASADPDASAFAAELAAVLVDPSAEAERELECTVQGEPRWLVVRARRASDEPLRVLITHTDATAARRARQAQWAILEQASEGVVVCDRDGRVLRASRRAAAMFGYSPEEMRGMIVTALVTEDDLARQPLYLAALREGREVRVERQGRRRDGSVVAYEVSSRMLEDGRILALIRDVTERLEREMELERRTVQLAERIKEQRCLYGVSRALEAGDDGLEAMLGAAAAALPGGWQYPELAGARISLDTIEVSSPGFRDGPYRQRVPIRIDGAIRGEIEVVYAERPSDFAGGGTLLTAEDAGPEEAGVFLREERSLLEEVAARVTGAVRRYRAEDRLRRSEAYFRALAEKGSDLISITGADGALLYQSPPLMEALGFRPEERVGKSIFDRIHPDDIARVKEAFGRIMLDPAYQPTQEFRVQHNDGSWRVFESTGRNLLSDPAVNGIVVESRDVTARRDAEDRIRFQAQVLALVGQAVVATDTEGLITYWNRAAEEIYGWSRTEVMRRPIHEVIPLDRTQPETARLIDAVGRGARWTGELLSYRRDGSRFPALIADTPIRDGAGNVTGYVTVATDISDRKSAEEALRAREEWSRALIENALDLTVVLDAGGQVLYSSPSRERVLGGARTGDPAEGPPELEVHPDDQATALEVWAGISSAPGATGSATVRVRHEDGSWRTLECIAHNLLDTPAVRGVVVNCRDVTDRVQLEQQLQQAQKMEAIGRLAGGVAHDFNNILTGIQGYTELSLDEVAADNPVRANLEEIGRAAERAARLTSQLLAFSRRQMMQPRVVDANQTVGDLRGMLMRLIGEDVTLSTELSPGAGCVLVDPGQLEQVIVNLAVNARDAMPLGGQVTIRTAPVRLGARDLFDAAGLEPGDYVEIDVSDTGSGMAPDVVERLFEPFFTTKELGKGTGLGLSTVYGVVKQSGGHIRVESLPNAGTTFRVLFPRVEGRPEPIVPRRLPPSQSGGETILLAEDDAAVRDLATRVLRRGGYQVLEARDGQEAWSVFNRHPGVIQLVLSDVVMPELGGRELVQRVVSERPGLPAILMSGYTDDVLLRHGARDVGADFLEKPFTPAALRERVRNALDRGRTAAATD